VTYTYECETCGCVTIQTYRISEMRRTITCPSCGGTSRKVIEAPFLVGVSTTKQRIKAEQIRKSEENRHKQRGSHVSMKTGRV
jgi:putative FmdB family regulatory protein